MHYLKQKEVIVRLILMTYVWVAGSLCYFMTGYYIARMPGDIFFNYYASGTADIVACLITGSIYNRLKGRKTFMLGFLVSTLGALLIVFIGYDHLNLLPIFVFLIKIGVQVVMVAAWIAPMGMFPTLF